MRGLWPVAWVPPDRHRSSACDTGRSALVATLIFSSPPGSAPRYLNPGQCRSPGLRSRPPGAQSDWPVKGLGRDLGRNPPGPPPLCGGRVGGQRPVELVSRADVQFHEHLAKVVLDRARADEEACCDLRVRQSVAGKLCDLYLLCGELGTCIGGAGTHGLAGRE